MTICRNGLLCVLVAMPAVAVCQASPACYRDTAAYMTATFGEHYRDDENIRLTGKTYGKQHFHLVEDLTSGANHPRVLLRELPGNGHCVILATPPAVQLDVVAIDAAGAPEAFRSIDQAPPGMPAHEISYRLTARMRYAAAVCKNVFLKGGKTIKQAASCAAFQLPPT